jgi:hypothetical protein
LEQAKSKKKKKEKEEVYNCAECKGVCELVYQLRLLVKDPSTQSNPYLYSVLLYSKDKMGAEFFNDTPKNLWIDDEARNKI